MSFGKSFSAGFGATLGVFAALLLVAFIFCLPAIAIMVLSVSVSQTMNYPPTTAGPNGIDVPWLQESSSPPATSSPYPPTDEASPSEASPYPSEASPYPSQASPYPSQASPYPSQGSSNGNTYPGHAVAPHGETTEAADAEELRPTESGAAEKPPRLEADGNEGEYPKEG